ncbi:hypothetical protein D3C79_1009170 [compost metagenome]
MPTPIPKIMPPKTVANKVSWVNGFRLCSKIVVNDSTVMPKPVESAKVLPICL